MGRAELVHFGIYCRDLEAMRKFYCDLFGLVQTDEGDTRIGYIAFLSSDPKEHHQLVLVSGRTPEQKSTVNQISFRFPEFSDLRAMRDKLEARAIAYRPIDHGIAWSLYIEDPEGNGIEIYVEAPYYITQPYGKLMDFGKSDAELLKDTEAMVRAEPSFRTRAQWEAEQRAKFAAA